MTQEEKIKVVAEYDGWKVIPEGTYNECHNQTTWYGHGGNFGCYHDIKSEAEMLYITSMDWLHPIAMKVIDELKQRVLITANQYTGSDDNDKPLYAIIKDAEYRIGNIQSHCSFEPVLDQYIDLFNSTYEGIELINKQSSSTPT